MDIPARNRVICPGEGNKTITPVSRAELEKLGKEQIMDLIRAFFTLAAA
jgi:hypothetical protein